MTGWLVGWLFASVGRLLAHIIHVYTFFVSLFVLIARDCIKDRADLCLFRFALTTLDGVRQINFNTNDMSTASTSDYGKRWKEMVKKSYIQKKIETGRRGRKGLRRWIASGVNENSHMHTMCVCFCVQVNCKATVKEILR